MFCFTSGNRDVVEVLSMSYKDVLVIFEDDLDVVQDL